MAGAELKKLLSHGAIYALGALLSRVVSFVMMPVYTRALSPAEYGVVDLLDTTAAVIVNLSNVAITYSVMRFYYDAKDEKGRGRVISTSLFGLVAFGSAAVLMLWPFGRMLSHAMFRTDQYAGAVRLMAVTAVFYGLVEVPMTFIRALERPWLYLAVSLGRLALGLVLNVVLVVWLRWGVMGVVYANVLASLATTVALVAFTLPRTGTGFSREVLTGMLRFGAPFIPGSFAMLVLHNGDRYILTSYSSLHDIGLYSLGYKLGMILSYAVSVPFSNVWSTRMYTVVDEPGGMETYRKVGLYFVYALLFGWVGLAATAPELVTIAAAPEYARAALFVPVIAGAYAIRETSEFYKNAFMIKRQTRFLGWVQPLVAGANLLLTLVLVRAMGAMGAAWATLLTFVLLLGLVAVPAEKLVPTKLPLRRVAIATGASLALVGVAWALPRMHLALAIPAKLALVLLFPVSLVAMGAIAPDDRARVLAKVRALRARVRGGQDAVTHRASLHPKS